jgi:hypothetical protein
MIEARKSFLKLFFIVLKFLVSMVEIIFESNNGIGQGL